MVVQVQNVIAAEGTDRLAAGFRLQRLDRQAETVPAQFQVAQRHAPRVLLADEVGLGKTIEAGMIIHQQVLSGRAERILIVVPETLQHQWLVEMMRRFNLHFSIFDEERCIEAFAESDNPFDTQQYVLCSLDFLRKSRKRYEQALEGEWITSPNHYPLVNCA